MCQSWGTNTCKRVIFGNLQLLWLRIDLVSRGRVSDVFPTGKLVGPLGVNVCFFFVFCFFCLVFDAVNIDFRPRGDYSTYEPHCSQIFMIMHFSQTLLNSCLSFSRQFLIIYNSHRPPCLSMIIFNSSRRFQLISFLGQCGLSHISFPSPPDRHLQSIYRFFHIHITRKVLNVKLTININLWDSNTMNWKEIP